MSIDDVAKGIKKSLRAATIIGMVAGPVAAQEQKSPPEPPRVEKPQAPIDQGIPFPKKYFKIDDFVAATEGTSEDRRKLAEELYAYMMQHGELKSDSSRESLSA